MKFFKIRHVPSGLFYKPSKHRSKKNLSKNGKTYATRAHAKSALTNIGNWYRAPTKLKIKDVSELSWSHPHRTEFNRGYREEPTNETEWEIVEYSMKEE